MHGQTTPTLTSAHTRGDNELKSLIPKPKQPAHRGVLPRVLSSYARQRDRVERPIMQLLVQPQPVTQLSKFNKE